MKPLFKLFVLIIFLLYALPVAADIQVRSSLNKDSEPAIAYNSANDEHLVVWTESSTTSVAVMGQRMKGDGTGTIGTPFTIYTIGVYPSVAYNSQSNEYLVTASLFGNIIGQRVSNTGALVGSPVTLISKTNSIWSKIIYNSLGNNYLLVAGELFDLGNDQANINIYTRKIDFNGQPIGTEQLIRNQGHGNYSDGARFSVAYAPITSAITPAGRYLLAIKDPTDLTMLDDNGVIVSRVYDSQHPGNIVDDHVPFQQSKVGTPHNVDVAFGNWEGENSFMVVWGDRNQQVSGQEWTGIWAGIVKAAPVEFYSNDVVTTTVFPVSIIWAHWATTETAKTWKPVVAYNKAAYKFMIAWRETPSTDPNNDTQVNHIRANAVSSSTIPPPANVVLSAITGSENPKNPAIAASTTNTNAFVVWDDSRNFATKDIDLYGSLLNTTPAKAFILTSPNGNEIWEVGSQHQIKWESNDIGNVDVTIEYSIDNGVSYQFVAFYTNIDGLNSFDWEVPNSPSTQCLVKISVSGVSDVSDAVFTITDSIPTITVISPNGGEVWTEGEQHEIKWTSTNFTDPVRIDFGAMVSAYWINIATNVPNNGSFIWTPKLSDIFPLVPPPVGSAKGFIRVAEATKNDPDGIEDGKAFDWSDDFFTIADSTPQITIISPNGGEVWNVGSQQEIKWTSTNFSDPVNIVLTTFDQIVISGVIAQNVPNTGSYFWTVTTGITDTVQASIRVEEAKIMATIHDESDSLFTIIDSTPRITVISPNGGEVWTVGEQHEIKWTSANFTDPVRIDLQTVDLLGGGILWANIATNTPNDGSFIWTLKVSDLPPVSLPTVGSIRVADATKNDPGGIEDGKVFDWSENYFTIADSTPRITVISPNGGEVWTEGEQHEIKWISEHFTDPVRIDFGSYVTMGGPIFPQLGKFIANIATNLPNTGSFIWTVPDFSLILGECEIRVADATKNNLGNPDDGKIFDMSDSAFTYYPKPNTSTGNNVVVHLNEGTEINFDKVDSIGITTQFIGDIGSPPPSGTKIFPFNSPKHYYIETTSIFSGNIEICLTYNDSSLSPQKESELRLNVYDTTIAKWQDITTSRDITNNIICGEVNHLSEFAITMPSGNELIVTNTNDSGDGSFRNAIDSANTNAGADIIKFNIPKTDPNFDAIKGIWTIQPVTYYQSILDSNTVIDGTSQRLFIAEDTNPEGPEIVISGSIMAANNGCLTILSNNTEIYELTINNFPSTAISFSQTNNGIVSGCFIGTDYSGMNSAGNYNGITLGYKVNNTLIGTSPYLQQPNVIAGNLQDGIFIVDSSQNNIVIGNYIGVNKNATDTLPNYLRGIDLSRGADNNIIMANIIGGNYQGIYVNESNNNAIIYNSVGATANWVYNLGNSDGIIVFNNSKGNNISENIVGYNNGGGIIISGANSILNLISRNSISRNLGLGIDNSDGGNGELSPPIILSAANNQITGTAGVNQIIELFADSTNEGEVFIDSTVTDASGNFSITVSSLPTFPNITATARDVLGNTSEFSSPFIVTDIEGEENKLPTKYALYQNYPNPFNPSTIIKYSVISDQKVCLKVFNVLGMEVALLVNENKEPGIYTVEFSGAGLASGTYFYRLQAGTFVQTKKFILMK